MAIVELRGPFGVAALAKSHGTAKKVLRRTAILEAVDSISAQLAAASEAMRTDAYVEEKKRLEGKAFTPTAWCRHVAWIDELIDDLHRLRAEVKR